MVFFDYKDIINMIINNYEKIKNILNIKQRIEFYSIIELLNNYQNTKNKYMLDLVKEKVKKNYIGELGGLYGVFTSI